MKSVRNSLFIILTAVSLHLTGCDGTEPDNGGTTTGGDGVPGNTEVIYEANPKVFATKGAFNAITARLDEIRSLGTTILWLMPVYEQGRENSIGSPYCIRDYKAVNSDFGTLSDLKNLVSEAHGQGMKVILDWVANHTAWDHAWITEHKDWYTQNSAGEIVSPSGWNDVADLNYGSQTMRAAMIDAMKYWIEETDADGFRCDYAEGVPLDFWTDAIAELRSLKSDLIMLAEGGDAGLFAADFDILYGWNYAGKLGDVFKGTASATDLYESNQAEFSVTPEGRNRMRYSTNHDRTQESATCPKALYKTEDGAMAAFVTAAFMGGIPMIYSSQEIAYLDSFGIFSYNIMDWDSNPKSMAEYQAVMKVYKETADQRGGEFKYYDTGTTLSFVWSGAKDTGLFIMVNTENEAKTIRVPMERAGTNVRNMMTGESAKLPSSMELEPYEYLIYETL